MLKGVFVQLQEEKRQGEQFTFTYQERERDEPETFTLSIPPSLRDPFKQASPQEKEKLCAQLVKAAKEADKAFTELSISVQQFRANNVSITGNSNAEQNLTTGLWRRIQNHNERRTLRQKITHSVDRFLNYQPPQHNPPPDPHRPYQPNYSPPGYPPGYPPQDVPQYGHPSSPHHNPCGQYQMPYQMQPNYPQEHFPISNGQPHLSPYSSPYGAPPLSNFPPLPTYQNCTFNCCQHCPTCRTDPPYDYQPSEEFVSSRNPFSSSPNADELIRIRRRGTEDFRPFSFRRSEFENEERLSDSSIASLQRQIDDLRNANERLKTLLGRNMTHHRELFEEIEQRQRELDRQATEYLSQMRELLASQEANASERVPQFMRDICREQEDFYNSIRESLERLGHEGQTAKLMQKEILHLQRKNRDRLNSLDEQMRQKVDQEEMEARDAQIKHLIQEQEDRLREALDQLEHWKRGDHAGFKRDIEHFQNRMRQQFADKLEIATELQNDLAFMRERIAEISREQNKEYAQFVALLTQRFEEEIERQVGKLRTEVNDLQKQHEGEVQRQIDSFQRAYEARCTELEGSIEALQRQLSENTNYRALNKSLQRQLLSARESLATLQSAHSDSLKRIEEAILEKQENVAFLIEEQEKKLGNLIERQNEAIEQLLRGHQLLQDRIAEYEKRLMALQSQIEMHGSDVEGQLIKQQAFLEYQLNSLRVELKEGPEALFTSRFSEVEQLVASFRNGIVEALENKADKEEMEKLFHQLREEIGKRELSFAEREESINSQITNLINLFSDREQIEKQLEEQLEEARGEYQIVVKQLHSLEKQLRQNQSAEFDRQFLEISGRADALETRWQQFERKMLEKLGQIDRHERKFEDLEKEQLSIREQIDDCFAAVEYAQVERGNIQKRLAAREKQFEAHLKELKRWKKKCRRGLMQSFRTGIKDSQDKLYRHIYKAQKELQRHFSDQLRGLSKQMVSAQADKLREIDERLKEWKLAQSSQFENFRSEQQKLVTEQFTEAKRYTDEQFAKLASEQDKKVGEEIRKLQKSYQEQYQTLQMQIRSLEKRLVQSDSRDAENEVLQRQIADTHRILENWVSNYASKFQELARSVNNRLGGIENKLTELWGKQQQELQKLREQITGQQSILDQLRTELKSKVSREEWESIQELVRIQETSLQTHIDRLERWKSACSQEFQEQIESSQKSLKESFVHDIREITQSYVSSLKTGLEGVKEAFGYASQRQKEEYEGVVRDLTKHFEKKVDTEIRAAREKLEDATGEVKRIQSTIDSQFNALNAKTKKIMGKWIEGGEYAQKQAALETELRKVLQSKEELVKEYKSLLEAYAKKEDLQALGTQLTSLVNEQNRKIEKQEEQYRQLDERIGKQENEIVTLKASLEEREQHLKRLEDRISVLEKDTHLREELEHQKQAHKTLQDKVNGLETNLKTTLHKEFDSQIRELTSRLNRFEEERATLENVVFERAQKYIDSQLQSIQRAYEEQNRHLQDSIENLKKQLTENSEYESINASLQARLRSCEEQLAYLQKTYQDSIGQIQKSFQKGVSQIDQVVHSCKQEFISLVNRQNETLAILQADHKTLKERITAYEKKLTELESQLKPRVEQALMGNEELQEQLRSLKESLRSDLEDEFTSRFESFETEIRKTLEKKADKEYVDQQMQTLQNSFSEGMNSIQKMKSLLEDERRNASAAIQESIGKQIKELDQREQDLANTMHQRVDALQKTYEDKQVVNLEEFDRKLKEAIDTQNQEFASIKEELANKVTREHLEERVSSLQDVLGKQIHGVNEQQQRYLEQINQKLGRLLPKLEQMESLKQQWQEKGSTDAAMIAKLEEDKKELMVQFSRQVAEVQQACEDKKKTNWEELNNRFDSWAQDWQEKVQGYEDRFGKLEGDHRSLASQFEIVLSQLSEYQSQERTNAKQIEQLSRDLTAFKEQYALVDKENKELQRENSDLKANQEIQKQLLQEMSKLKERVDKLETEKANQADLEGVKAKQDELFSGTIQVLSVLAEQKEEQAQNLEGLLERIRRRAGAEDDTYSTLQEAIEKFHAAQEGWMEKQKKAQETMKNLNRETENYSTKTSKLNDLREEVTRLLSSRQDEELSKQNEVRKKLVQAKSDFETAVKNLDQERDSLLRKVIKEKEEALKKITDKEGFLKKEAESLQIQLGQQPEQVAKQVAETIAQMTSQLKETEEKLVTLLNQKTNVEKAWKEATAKAEREIQEKTNTLKQAYKDNIEKLAEKQREVESAAKEKKEELTAKMQEFGQMQQNQMKELENLSESFSKQMEEVKSVINDRVNAFGSMVEQTALQEIQGRNHELKKTYSPENLQAVSEAIHEQLGELVGQLFHANKENRKQLFETFRQQTETKLQLLFDQAPLLQGLFSSIVDRELEILHTLVGALPEQGLRAFVDERAKLEAERAEVSRTLVSTFTEEIATLREGVDSAKRNRNEEELKRLSIEVKALQEKYLQNSKNWVEEPGRQEITAIAEAILADCHQAIAREEQMGQLLGRFAHESGQMDSELQTMEEEWNREYSRLIEKSKLEGDHPQCFTEHNQQKLENLQEQLKVCIEKQEKLSQLSRQYEQLAEDRELKSPEYEKWEKQVRVRQLAIEKMQREQITLQTDLEEDEKMAKELQTLIQSFPEADRDPEQLLEAYRTLIGQMHSEYGSERHGKAARRCMPRYADALRKKFSDALVAWCKQENQPPKMISEQETIWKRAHRVWDECRRLDPNSTRSTHRVHGQQTEESFSLTAHIQEQGEQEISALFSQPVDWPKDRSEIEGRVNQAKPEENYLQVESLLGQPQAVEEFLSLFTEKGMDKKALAGHFADYLRKMQRLRFIPFGQRLPSLDLFLFEVERDLHKPNSPVQQILEARSRKTEEADLRNKWIERMRSFQSQEPLASYTYQGSSAVPWVENCLTHMGDALSLRAINHADMGVLLPGYGNAQSLQKGNDPFSFLGGNELSFLHASHSELGEELICSRERVNLGGIDQPLEFFRSRDTEPWSLSIGAEEWEIAPEVAEKYAEVAFPFEGQFLPLRKKGGTEALGKCDSFLILHKERGENHLFHYEVAGSLLQQREIPPSGEMEGLSLIHI